MTLNEQVYAQAVMLAGTVEEDRQPLLQMFVQSAVNGLQGRLREGLTVDDCRADFLAAGALYALAALAETDQITNMERVQFADVTLVSGGASAACRCLRRQADIIIGPYCRDRFDFRGV